MIINPDLTVEYMGLKLKNPLVAAASPLSHRIENIRQLEQEGIAAVVMFSLFEEQIVNESLELHHHLTYGTESYAEALTFYPQASQYTLTPAEYLKHITKAKKSVQVPIIGSLNGFTLGGWTKYAKRIEEAGADGLE